MSPLGAMATGQEEGHSCLEDEHRFSERCAPLFRETGTAIERSDTAIQRSGTADEKTGTAVQTRHRCSERRA